MNCHEEGVQIVESKKTAVDLLIETTDQRLNWKVHLYHLQCIYSKLPCNSTDV